MSYEIREYYIDDPFMAKLFMQSWCPQGTKPRGSVLITHGLAEHSECYDALAKKLCDQGWMVFAWDLQGHGKSQGPRGYIKEFDHYSRDLLAVIKKIKEDKSFPTTQLHLIGHSMGGLISLQALCQDKTPKIQSLSLSNPALGVAIQVPALKHLASEVLFSVWPTFTLDNEVRYHLLSRDPAMMDVYAKDPLRHRKISPPLYLGMLKAQQEVKDNYRKLKVPVFFQISGQDKIVSPQVSIDFYKSLLGEKTIKIYEDSYHEVYNDLNKSEAIEDLCHYLGERSQ
jgi:alpha-beta hydrolase superfamily lysophospholipase